MNQPDPSAKRGGRAALVIAELFLLAATLWILIWSPFGQGASMILATMLALVFIGLFPAMLKGARVEQAEREHIARRYSQGDDNRNR